MFGKNKGVATAQWIRLHLPSCGPRFDPQAQHLYFLNINLNCDEKRTKISHFGLIFA